MTGMDSLGKTLLLLGGALALLGLLLVFAPKVPYVGRLPGDLVFHRGNLTIHLPLATMLLASVGLTLLLNLASRLFRG